MANPIEESFISVPKICDIEAIILKSVSNPQKWEKFKKALQPAKNQTSIEKCEENEKDSKVNKGVLKIPFCDKFFKGTHLESGISAANIGISVCPPKSSISFKSETECDTLVSTARNLKKPFLRKRSGLLRYTKKPVSQSKPSKKVVFSGIKEIIPFKSNLKSKPLVTDGTTMSPICHVGFEEFNYSDKNEAENLPTPKDREKECLSTIQTSTNDSKVKRSLNNPKHITEQMTVNSIEPILCISEDVVHDSSKPKDISGTTVEELAFRQKIEELEMEIEIYRKQNARLLELCKEKEESLRKLKEEYDGIHRLREDQKENLKIEIEKEKQQLKKKKETFLQYQKLKKDNPSRKEQEEMVALMEELRKLQEEQKQLRIKFFKENKRMKSQLIEIGKERDSLKLKNSTLEGQQKDLIAAIKIIVPKTKKPDLCTSEKPEPDSSRNNPSDKLSNQVTSLQTNKRSFSKKGSSINKTETDSTLKPRVDFNFNLRLENSTPPNIEKDVGCDESDKHKEPCKKLNEVESSSLPKELTSPDKVEKLYPSGDREIIFPSGNRKFISAKDGTTTMTFHNGDVLQMYPDKLEVYKYANGMVEKSLPCGTKITEFPNGQIEHDYPGGLKEVLFPNGTLHCIHNDGLEEIKFCDGTKVTVSPDGTEVIERINGEREIKMANCKRREFPDGSVRILYTSGKMETRYPNGRIKVKDKNGRIILDTKHLKN